MARKSDVANVKVDPDAGFVRFTFSPECGGDVVTIVPSELPENVQKWAAFHGINQKLRDSYAGKDGKDAREAFDRVREALAAGKLSTRGEGDGAQVGAFAEAFRRLMVKMGKAPADWPAAKARETLASMDDERKKALRGSKQIVAILAEIANEKATKDAGEILADVEIAA